MRSKGLLRFLIFLVVLLFCAAGFLGYKTGLLGDMFPDVFPTPEETFSLGRENANEDHDNTTISTDVDSALSASESESSVRPGQVAAAGGLHLQDQRADVLLPGISFARGGDEWCQRRFNR